MAVYWNPSTGTYSEGKTDYVAEQKAKHPNFDTLPESAKKAALADWAKEAPKDEAVEVAPSVETVREATERAKEATKIADAGSAAKKSLAIAVLSTWSRADAEKVVGKKTVKTGGVEKEVDLTAIEELRDAAGLLGWPAFIGWIATKPESKKKAQLKDTDARDWTANEGIDPEIVSHVYKLATK